MSEGWKARGNVLVLLALRDGPKHGYDVASYIAEKSAGVFALSFGAIYPILHKLEADDLVSARWEDGESARQKKTYELTRKGGRILQDELDAYKNFSSALVRLAGDHL